MLGHTRTTAAINNSHNISETIEPVSTLQQATKTFHYSNIWNCDKWLHRYKILFRNIEAKEPWRDIKTQVKVSRTSQNFSCPLLALRKLQQNTKPPASLTIIKSGKHIFVGFHSNLLGRGGLCCGLESTLHCFTINFFTSLSRYFLLSFIIICFVHFQNCSFCLLLKLPCSQNDSLKTFIMNEAKTKQQCRKRK